MKHILSLLVLLLVTGSVFAQRDFYQSYEFTKADTLRGALRAERTCYDVTFYELDIKVDVERQYLSGYVDMTYQVKEDFKTLQIDLFENMQINGITFLGKKLKYRREAAAVFVDFPKRQKQGSSGSIRIAYEGKPIAAKNAPWDGGFVWKKDENGKAWVGVACEGDGASLWWPNKDHLSDEPDSVSIKVAVPNELVCASNGNLRATEKLNDGYTRYDWFVSYPINNYNVSITIADFAHFSDTYTAEDDETLDLDYYVLSYNLEKAKKQFEQVEKMLACYERYFGKYPFWKDGFSLIETPYLGMEHQSGIAYGNQYMRGYLGGLIPKHMDWDYIIIHETGHEYFGNSISCNDLSEMWIHESFTTYMEALYVECIYNFEEAIGYLISQRQFIYNQEPIIGPKDVNWEDWKSSDHYYKGAWVLHTLRHAIGDDAVWFDLLKSFYQRYAISNIDSEDFFNYVNQCTRRDFSRFFEQYLYYPSIPILEYQLEQQGKDLQVRYRWNADVEGFDMPILAGKQESYWTLYPSDNWKTSILQSLNKSEFKVATELFYVDVMEVK